MPVVNPIPPVLSAQRIEIFWGHVDKSPGLGPFGDCWVFRWHHPKTPQDSSHLSVKIGKRRVNVHRLAFYLVTGIWTLLNLCHKCDIGRCCNPDHLFEGTQAENIADMMSKQRHGSQRYPDTWMKHGERLNELRRENPEKVAKGSRNGCAKLTEIDIPIIRLAHQEGATILGLSKRFKVSRPVIKGIIMRTGWKHVP